MENKEFATHLAPKQKVDLIEQKEAEEKDITEIELKEYKPRFLKCRAYRLYEDSTIHCNDGQKLYGKSGDFYVSLDMVKEFILTEDIFKKLFIIKHDE